MINYHLAPDLANNVNVSELTDLGYVLVYNFTYIHNTTTEEILQIRAQCNSSTLMCVGGSDPNADDVLQVVACSDCLSITTQTKLDQPLYSNSVYWYFTPGYSFGFAPNSLIIQSLADTHEQNSNQRLSWHLTGVNGGWRLGNEDFLNNDTLHTKKVFLKYSSKHI